MNMRGVVCVCAMFVVVTTTVAHAQSTPTAAQQQLEAIVNGTREKPKPKAKSQPFGPFDAGESRRVVRQGQVGLPRRAHPAVGARDKVPGDGPTAPPPRPDADIPETALHAPNTLGPGLSSNPLYLASLVYSKVLTRADGPRCEHLPTCSRFASQAVARHGLVGIWMGLDRLVQPNQSSAVRLLPEVEGYGRPRAFDPLENYEFWHTERFTGFPLPTLEVPLLLAPLPAPTASVTSSPSVARTPSLVAAAPALATSTTSP